MSNVPIHSGLCKDALKCHCTLVMQLIIVCSGVVRTCGNVGNTNNSITFHISHYQSVLTVNVWNGVIAHFITPSSALKSLLNMLSVKMLRCVCVCVCPCTSLQCMSVFLRWVLPQLWPSYAVMDMLCSWHVVCTATSQVLFEGYGQW